MSGQEPLKVKKHLCVGLLAHVDSGKTTFSEQLLYHAGAIRTPGRVDRQDTVMDANPIEKERGITIFADQGSFTYGDSLYYLIDTPGHVDFSAETERAVAAMDYAVLLLDGSGLIPAHTVTLFGLLKRYRVPVFFFINKMDLASSPSAAEETVEAVRARLTEDAVLVDGPEALSMEGSLGEFTAERDEAVLEAYLEGRLDRELGTGALKKLIKDRRAFIAMAGSALKDQGILEFLQVFDCLTDTDYRPQEPFSGLVYKVRRDSRGRRLTYIKVLSGRLKIKDEFTFCLPGSGEKVREKVNDLMSSFGSRLNAVSQVEAGDLAAVTGLTVPMCGDLLKPENTEEQAGREKFLMVPALEARVLAYDGTDSHRLHSCLKILEDEDPQLGVRGVRLPGGEEQICVRVMGTIQLEVLKRLMEDRFGIRAEFLPPKVLYQETILRPVAGYGHYEPLRHYAEVNLLLEPAPRGSGISFESRCHVDTLSSNYQNLVRTHVFERVHRGILTGFPLTDVKVVLTAGRSHLKHTEGGDFREATYRAIRQGLEKAENLLLEPFYQFEITAPAEYTGRILSDIQRLSGESGPPLLSGDWVVVQGSGPVSTFMDYSRELAAATRGSASISMVNGGYRPCHNQEEVVRETGYDKGGDTEQPSSSVFCAHGAGFTVNWDEAESYMHCLKG